MSAPAPGVRRAALGFFRFCSDNQTVDVSHNKTLYNGVQVNVLLLLQLWVNSGLAPVSDIVILRGGVVLVRGAELREGEVEHSDVNDERLKDRQQLTAFRRGAACVSSSGSGGSGSDLMVCKMS